MGVTWEMRNHSAWKYHTLPFGESQACTTICYLETAKLISNIYIAWRYSTLSFLRGQKWGTETSKGSQKMHIVSKMKYNLQKF